MSPSTFRQIERVTSSSFYKPWSAGAANLSANTTPGKDFGRDFGSGCQADNAKVGHNIDCTVVGRRFGSRSFSMLLTEVGLPPGADVDRTSPAKILDTWTIGRYELQADRIVIYLWPWRADGEHFSFRFTPRYPIRAKVAPSTLSDYYNRDMQVVLAPQSFQVQ